MTKHAVWLPVLLAAAALLSRDARAADARQIVEKAFDYYRGQASVAVVEMIVHRPDWERRMTIKAWTRGQQDSLFRIISPAKDRGNGTLKKGRQMWMYNPKVNRVIKLPPSMMSQSWMGSDFSNNDLAKSDSLLADYTHSITGTETSQGHRVYLVRSLPKPGAPVVWGMQRLKIRDDHIFLAEAFFDEEHRLVKKMSAHTIEMLGHRLFPKIWRMRKVEDDGSYTELHYQQLDFQEDLAANIFTLGNLRSRSR
jgi:outer membrane lipoprotein-sorting protein